jgi:hypothetical protein
MYELKNNGAVHDSVPSASLKILFSLDFFVIVWLHQQSIIKVLA